MARIAPVLFHARIGVHAVCTARKRRRRAVRLSLRLFGAVLPGSRLRRIFGGGFTVFHLAKRRNVKRCVGGTVLLRLFFFTVKNKTAFVQLFIYAVADGVIAGAVVRCAADRAADDVVTLLKCLVTDRAFDPIIKSHKFSLKPKALRAAKCAYIQL